MGMTANFSETQETPISGVRRMPFSHGRESAKASAQLLQIDPGAEMHETVASGTDSYWFVCEGTGEVCEPSAATLRKHSFMIAPEGMSLVIKNPGDSALQLLHVVAPPAESGENLPGYSGGLVVTHPDDVPIVDIVDQKKKRKFFVGHDKPHALPTQRGQAMIVMYEKTTEQPRHFHPNAESIFLPIDGAMIFTINGEKKLISPGTAVYFGVDDIHSSKVAAGFDGAAFVEFHLPADFSTTRL